MLDVLIAIAVIGYLIYRQLAGQALRAKMVLALPVVLTVYGVTQLTGHGQHLHPADIGLLAAGALGTLIIGAGIGALTRLENRDGGLWGKLPLRGLWLWAAAFAVDGGIHVAALGLHAKVAASGAPILLLGLNRLAQAGVIAARALAAGIPFAPDNRGNRLQDRAGRIRGAYTDPGSRQSQEQPGRDGHHHGNSEGHRHDHHDHHGNRDWAE
jgi:hypothetical protein